MSLANLFFIFFFFILQVRNKMLLSLKNCHKVMAIDNNKVKPSFKAGRI